MMGPMSGEINMAPMTTAVESTFNPMLAITMEKTRIQRLNPRNSMSFDALYGGLVSQVSDLKAFNELAPKPRRCETRRRNWGCFQIIDSKTPDARTPGFCSDELLHQRTMDTPRFVSNLDHIGAHRQVAQVNREAALDTNQWPLSNNAAIHRINEQKGAGSLKAMVV